MRALLALSYSFPHHVYSLGWMASQARLDPYRKDSKPGPLFLTPMNHGWGDLLQANVLPAPRKVRTSHLLPIKGAGLGLGRGGLGGRQLRALLTDDPTC